VYYPNIAAGQSARNRLRQQTLSVIGIMARDILHKMKTLAGAGWRRQLLVAEACASMFAARMLLLVLPFSRKPLLIASLSGPSRAMPSFYSEA